MLEHIVRLTVSMTVVDEHLAEFKRVSAIMTEGSKAEAGTLGYEWFASAKGNRFRQVETYAGAHAIEAHFTGQVVGEWVPRLAALCTIDGIEIYGDPGPKVREMAGGLGAAFYEYWLGIDR